MVSTYTRLSYQVSVYMIIVPLVTIYGHNGHLSHVSSIMSINFHSLVPESLHTKFGSTAQWFLIKACCNFHM